MSDPTANSPQAEAYNRRAAGTVEDERLREIVAIYGDHSSAPWNTYAAIARELIERRAPSRPVEDGELVERLRRAQAISDLEGSLFGDVMGNAADALTSLRTKLAEVEAERDEAVNWTATVERHGTDGFDALADTWLSMEAIKRVNNAVTSVFAKSSNDEIMGRFKQHMTDTMHLSFVEGCIVGVKAEMVNSSALSTRLQEAEKALEEARPLVDAILTGPDPDKAVDDLAAVLDRARSTLKGEAQTVQCNFCGKPTTALPCTHCGEPNIPPQTDQIGR